MKNRQKDIIRIKLFGNFGIWQKNSLVSDKEWHTEANKTLVKILAGEPGRFFSQDELIEALWPEGDPSKAASSLRRRIAEVRRVLEPNLKSGRQSQYVQTRREGYCFNPETDCWIDVLRFPEYITKGRAREERGQHAKALQAYEAAVTLYVGEYLSEDPYAEWALIQRTHWREQHLALLERLSECYARCGQYRRAIRHCRVLLKQHPYHEHAYRQLMLYYHLSGFSAEAQQAYHQCTHTLGEVEVKPAPETQALFEQICQGVVPGIEQRYPTPPTVSRVEIPYTLAPRSIPFVGREQELSRLLGQVARAHQGQGGCVMIAGEAGVGKTRLAQEVLDLARRQVKVKVFQGVSQEMGAQLAYQPWVEAVREGLEQLSQEELESIAPVWLSEVASLVPQLHSRLPTLPKNSPLAPQQAQLRLFEGLVQFFLELTATKQGSCPLLIMLDDLMWADAASLDFLGFFLARIETKPVLVLGTYRNEDVNETHPLHQHIQHWDRRGWLTTFSLTRLAAPEVAALLQRLPLVVKKPDLFFQRLYTETEGNPLYLVATLQHFFEEGLLRVEDGDWVSDVEDLSKNHDALMIPPTVKALIERQVARLDERERALLRLASVVGKKIDFDLIERVWNGPGDPLTALEGVLRAHLVVEQGNRYAFSHDKVREIVYGALPTPRRRRLHAAVLDALEADQAAPEVLARHAFRAGLWEKSVKYADNGAWDATDAFRHEAALEQIELGLGALDEIWAKGGHSHLEEYGFKLLLCRSQVWDRLGKREAQQRDLETMVQLARRLNNEKLKARVRYHFGLLAYRKGDYDEAESAVIEAAETWASIEDANGQMLAYGVLGLIRWQLGRLGEALDDVQRALALSRELGIAKETAAHLNNIGNIYKDLGHIDASLEHYRQSLEMYEANGFKDGEAMTSDNLSVEYRKLGQFSEALALNARALGLFHEMGLRQAEQIALNNQGKLCQHLGRTDEALSCLEQAMATCEEISDARNRGFILNNFGSVYRQLGDFDKAHNFLEKALAVRRDINDLMGQGVTLTNLGHLDRALGHPAEGLSHYRAAAAFLEPLGAVPEWILCLSGKAMALLEGEDLDRALARSEKAVGLLGDSIAGDDIQEVHFNHFQILTACGQAGVAAAALKRAVDEVNRRAGHVPEAYHTAFLNVPLNQQILRTRVA